MSRIGRMPIAVPAGVTVEIAENNKVTVKGPKGTLERVLPAEMDIKQEGSEIVVSRPNDLKKMKSLHGLTRTLIHNMIIGVTEGYEKKLEVNGVGYRAQKQGKKLVLSDTGAVKNAMILSVPEGDDKPLKYPLMFSICDVLLVNKIDVAPYFNFDLDKCVERVKKLNPNIQVFPISALKGEGIEPGADWLREQTKTWNA